MKSRYLTTSLVALALALPATRAAAQPDVVAITRRASPAVITLNTYNAAGRKTGLGSGFFLSDGRIATNRHVIEGSARVEAVTQDERRLGTATFAEAVGGATADLAILPRITNPPATLPLAAGLPEVGEAVIVIGAPEGLSNTVSTGIVSAIRRIQGKTLVQISAPISHGSSGGPVLNSRGQVIGVSVSVLSEGQNLNFAVPVTELSRLAQTQPGRVSFTGDLRGGAGVSGGTDISSLDTRRLPRLTLGQTVTGRLNDGDVTLPDGSYADAFAYTGRAGEQITVALQSNDFDAYAVVDDPNGPLRESDDDSGGNYDSELTVTLPHAGTYIIVANSVASGATGAYRLSLRAGGGRPSQNDGNNDGGTGNGGRTSTGDEFDLATAVPIRGGQTVSGQLTRSDHRREDNSFADSYVYNGRAGERLTITMRSTGFEPWIVVDEPDGPYREHSATGRTGQLTVTLPRTTRYIILANAVNANATGSYTLSVQSSGAGGPVPSAPPSSGGGAGGDISDMNVRSLPSIAPGQAVSGRLTTSDFLRSDGSYADGYVYRGRAGEQITVTLRSPDMDAWVVVDEPDGPFRETDDDGAGGTDSQLTVTLPRTGTYLIVANSVGSPNTGRYTLEVRSGRRR